MKKHTGTPTRLMTLLGIIAVGLITGCTRTPAASTGSATTIVPYTTTIPTGSTIHGVFAGTTPCSQAAPPLPQIPANVECEQMIWDLTLYHDQATGSPTTYTLSGAYGLSQPGTPGLRGGGTTITLTGQWNITRGIPADSDAIVYQLNTDSAKPVVEFLRVNDNLLHVLERDRYLIVGHGAWSYTINRIDNRTPTAITGPLSAPPAEGPTPVLPPQPPDSSVFGIFVGRTPCNDQTFAFTKTAPYAGCEKIKWQLTLYQDRAGAPSTYMYRGTRTFRTGSWTVIEDSTSQSSARVYQLNLDAGSISFLNIDDNHLLLLDNERNLFVGNELFSYTLSRSKPAQPE